MHYIKDLYANDHPPASTRFVYTFMVMVYCIINEIDEISAVKEISTIAKVGTYFDRVYYDADTFDLSLTALAFTERGTRHLDDLHNGWNEVRDKLESVSYILLKYNEPIDFETLSWLDGDGNIIHSKCYENILEYHSRKMKGL